MGKKKLNSLEKALLQEADQIERTTQLFYGKSADMIEVADNDPFLLFFSEKKPVLTQTFSEEEVEAKCKAIRERVKESKEDSVEINLISGTQKYGGISYPLAETVMKVVFMDVATPIFIRLRHGDSINAIIFIGGEDAQAFLLRQNEENEIVYDKISEFHLLSIRASEEPRKEIGLITSYNWLTSQLFSSIIKGFPLDPVKNLLLSGATSQNTAQIERRERQ